MSFVRFSFFKGTPPQLDGAVELIRERIDPSFRTQAGYLGTVVVIDRESGQGMAGTYWQTAAQLSAAEEMGVGARGEATERAGIQLTDVDRFERIFGDRLGASRPGPGFIRITEFRGSPDKTDAVVALTQEKLVPLLRSQAGYRATAMAVNRTTGRLLASSIWETAADREASEHIPSDLRQQAAQLAGAASFRVIRAELVLTTLTPAALEVGVTTRTA